LIGRIPPAAQAITIVALAFVAVAGTMWKPGAGGAEETPRAQLVRTAFAAPNVEAPVATETFAQPAQDEPVTAAPVAAAAPRTEIIPPDPFAAEEERENQENQRRIDLTTADGSAESAPPADLMVDTNLPDG
jgi:hypothetical protein